jgi:hypothetical protein
MLHCYLRVYFYGLPYVWLYLCLFLWVLPVYATCIRLLLFQCESVYLQMYLYVYVLYIDASARDLSTYNLIAYSSKNSCGIAQLDVGYVPVCSVERTKRVLWHSVARHGWSGTLQYGIKATIFNTEPGWAEQVELKRNFIEDLFRSGQISSCRASSYNMVQKLKKFGHVVRYS